MNATATAAESSLALSGVRSGELIGGKYRVEGVIGEGGMGVVLYAIHQDLERPVAIKVVRADLLDRAEVIERMLLEARAAANIRSEHVARVLDVGQLQTGSPYIVMEYLEGCDLCSLLEHHGRLAYDVAANFVIQACEALAEAHSLGIIHRDLKPENLFLTAGPDGEPSIKVLDFGISKYPVAGRRSITNPSNAVGSPHYMAPEQMRATDPIDARADIWALGAILYELVTGQAPFDADTVPTICALVVSEEPARPRALRPEIPVGLDTVIWRCLRKNPAQRYQSVADLALALAMFGSPAAELSAERVSRISATTHQRASVRVSMPSVELPRLPSIIPLSSPRATTERLTRERRMQRQQRKRTALIAAAAAATAVAVVLIWMRVADSLSSDGAAVIPAPPPPVEQRAEEPRFANVRSAESPEPVAPHRSVEELPAERPRNETVPQLPPAEQPTRRQSAARPAKAAERPRRAASTRVDADQLDLLDEPASRTSKSKPPAAPPQPGTEAPVDAWDSTRFGGRY